MNHKLNVGTYKVTFLLNVDPAHQCFPFIKQFMQKQSQECQTRLLISMGYDDVLPHLGQGITPKGWGLMMKDKLYPIQT